MTRSSVIGRIVLLNFQTGIYALILSTLTDAEIQEAPEDVKKIYLKFSDCADQFLELTGEVEELANAYLQRGILSTNYRDDARHIALATTASVDILVSWNFKHIVHFKKIRMFNAVNLEKGYKPILIHSPREVIYYDG